MCGFPLAAEQSHGKLASWLRERIEASKGIVTVAQLEVVVCISDPVICRIPRGEYLSCMFCVYEDFGSWLSNAKSYYLDNAIVGTFAWYLCLSHLEGD